MTVDDLERPITILAEKMRLRSPPAKKIWTKIDPYYQQQKSGRWF